MDQAKSDLKDAGQEVASGLSEAADTVKESMEDAAEKAKGALKHKAAGTTGREDTWPGRPAYGRRSREALCGAEEPSTWEALRRPTWMTD